MVPFFLATSVILYSAGMFHRRSLREIYALRRKGSRVPVKRFIRVGSMNLLVRKLLRAHYAYISLGFYRSFCGPLRCWLLRRHLHPPARVLPGPTSAMLLTMFLLAGTSLSTQLKAKVHAMLNSLCTGRFLEVYSKAGPQTPSPRLSLGKFAPGHI